MCGDNLISILRRLIEGGQVSPAAAEVLLQLSFTAADQDRIAELGSKSTQGTLSEEESAEYDSYIAAADLLSLWKSKARMMLKQHNPAA